MIITHTYDNRKICNGCNYFEPSKNKVEGQCVCKSNRIRDHFRLSTDKKCSWWTPRTEENWKLFFQMQIRNREKL